ncbi:MAG: helix-turn-helix transcriptional regulator, partial [Candidatus Hadarchaeota archaeon]|nr:helix-turn-helix transcriptional regulator [Candidatus Hadarchaeota archaeon]
EALGERPRYVRELSSVMSSRTALEGLSQLEDLGFVEKQEKSEGRGRPRTYYRLTSTGRGLNTRLNALRDDLPYLATIASLRTEKVAVTAGVPTSLASFYHAPLVVAWRDLAVPQDFAERARTIVRRVRRMKGVGTHSKIDVEEVPWSGFEERSVTSDGVSYLGTEDLIVLTSRQGRARHLSCLPGVIYDRERSLNYRLLLKLSTGAGVVGEVGGILDTTNRLAGKDVVPTRTLKRFQESAPRRRVKRSIFDHPFVKRGWVPFRESPVDSELRKRWGVVLPTFREIKEIWELGGHET